jgi:hypothetical protein
VLSFKILIKNGCKNSGSQNHAQFCAFSAIYQSATSKIPDNAPNFPIDIILILKFLYSKQLITKTNHAYLPTTLHK